MWRSVRGSCEKAVVSRDSWWYPGTGEVLCCKYPPFPFLVSWSSPVSQCRCVSHAELTPSLMPLELMPLGVLWWEHDQQSLQGLLGPEMLPPAPIAFFPVPSLTFPHNSRLTYFLTPFLSLCLSLLSFPAGSAYAQFSG